MRRNKNKKEPSRQHPSQLPSRIDSLGHVMTVDEQKREWKQKGLCVECGLVQVSRRTWSMRREVLTIPGKVYKGVCLRCSSLEEAKVQLGEADPSSNRKRRVNLSNPSIAVGSRAITSDQSGTNRAVVSKNESVSRTSPRRGVSRDRVDILSNQSPMRSPPQRGMSRDRTDIREEDNGTLEQRGIPRDVGPRMGGLQKQISEITLDSTMLDMDLNPRGSHSERNITHSLDNIVEDDSSHRSGLQQQLSANRPGAFTSGGGAMERLEAKIRAKADAAGVKSGHQHQHVHLQHNLKGGNVEKDAEPNLVAEQSFEHAKFPGLSTSDHSGSLSPSKSSETNDDLGRLKPDGSSSGSSRPGAVNMTGDRLNVYEDRIRRKNAESLVKKGPSSTSKGTSHADNPSLSEWLDNSDKVKREDHGIRRLKTEGSGGEASKPGVVNMTGDRLNVYEQRIRRKNAESLVKKRSHTNDNNTKNPDLSHSERSGDIEGGNHRLETNVGTESEESKPGAFVMQGDRLNVYEQRIRRKNAESLAKKHPHSADKEPDNISSSEPSEDNETRRLKTDGSGGEASKPGVVNMTGDRLNVYEQRIRRKNAESLAKQHSSSTDKHSSQPENISLSERSGNGDRKEKLEYQDLRRVNTVGSKTEESKPGVVNMTGDRLNLYEDRIRRKNAKSFTEKPTPRSDNFSLGERSASERITKPGVVNMEGDLLHFYERTLNRKNAQFNAPSDEKRGNQSSIEQLDNSSLQDSSLLDTKYQRSKTNESSPGAVHYDTLDATNLFHQRNQEKINPNKSDASSSTEKQSINPKEKHAQHGSRRKHQYHVSGTECTTELDAREELSEIKDSGNCDDVIGFLRLHSNSLTPSTAIFAFECIRDMLTEDYGKSEKTTLFRSKVSWLKLFSLLMYSHFSNELVQSEALKTLWSIASYSSRHAADIHANDEITEAIVDSMEAHQSEDVNEYGSGLCSCLAVSEKDALSLLKCCDGQIVERLTAVLTSKSSRGVAEFNSMRALCRLSMAFHCNQEGCFGDLMGQCLTDDERLEDYPSAKSIFAVLEAMHQHPNDALLLAEGSRLLCQLCARDAILDDEVFFFVLESILDQMEPICSIRSHSLALSEALIYLLSHLSTYCHNTIEDHFPFSNVVIEIMSTHADYQSIALNGCRFIYNVCCTNINQVRSTVGTSGGVEVILKCMSTFENNSEILGEACGALFALCCESPSNKKRVIDLAGVRTISAAFNFEGLDSEDDDILSLNIRACAALITLSVDPSALEELIREGIIEKFSLLLEDGDKAIQESLRMKIEELVNMPLQDECSFESNMDEEETCSCLVLNLKSIMTSQVDSKKALMLQTNTVSSMQKFPSNDEIQILGCKIFACLFGASRSSSTNGLETVITCISSTNAMTVAAAASTFRNFCTAQPSSELDSYDSMRLTNVLLRSVDEFIKTIETHKNDAVVVEQVTSALWAIATVEGGAISSFESKEFISQIVEFINKFQSSQSLLRNCLGLLHVFFSSSDKTMDFLTDNLLVALIQCLQSDKEDVASVAISTAWAITEKGQIPAAIMMVNHHETLIGAIVECMFKFPSSSVVIRSACSLLSNISLDNYYRSAICNMGGAGRINEALVAFTGDEVTTCKALMSLTNLISGCDVEVLRLNEVAKNIIQVMATFSEDLCIQVQGASAIWHLASRNDLFKDILVDTGAVQSLSEAMTRFITSEKMTRKGIVALWSLSVPQHLKGKVVQQGLACVMNGMSAHITSEKVCEEGLGALKSLSTVNKETLESNDALDLIYSCMWLHSHNPNIQQASLAALVNLSVDMERNQVSRITFEDLDTIVNILRIHQDVKAVQENAIILLRNLTFSPHNCRVLQENVFLSSLVRLAMANFHETFQGRAEDLLRVLPQDSQ